jgi:hypothetical protein
VLEVLKCGGEAVMRKPVMSKVSIAELEVLLVEAATGISTIPRKRDLKTAEH